VPADAVNTLRSTSGVYSVTPNQAVQFSSTVDGYDPGNSANKYSWTKMLQNTKLKEMFHNKYTGKGVDVALIDSGVSPVPGLSGSNLVYGPDLSFESQAPNLRYLDTYGHGTHMAGLIAGRDANIPVDKEEDMVNDAFEGAAPGARVVSIKVAASNGATDVSQVIAGIDWVVQHRNTDGLNIRVLNLSFGTDGTQSYLLDPLTYAAEVAWFKGIVVVVAAGNSGFGTTRLNNPAYDPFVIAVGADDTKGTDSPGDDTIPAFQSRGDSVRHPDFVAPGQSAVSLRDPGSFIDQANPSARIGTTPRFFKGSGSSQAAAITSGAVADLLQQRPQLTPDQVKYILGHTATTLPVADPVSQGAGLINMKNARESSIPSLAVATQTFARSTGLGTLQGARGSLTVYDSNGVALTGEQDIFGAAWDGNAWSGNAWSGNAWSGGVWNGNAWSGNAWSGNAWSGNAWSGNAWSGNAWSGNAWSGNAWSGNAWSGNAWSGNAWSGDNWGSAPVTSPLAGNAWSSNLWS
jgi:serine protease AprX